MLTVELGAWMLIAYTVELGVFQRFSNYGSLTHCLHLIWHKFHNNKVSAFHLILVGLFVTSLLCHNNCCVLLSILSGLAWKFVEYNQGRVM